MCVYVCIYVFSMSGGQKAGSCIRWRCVAPKEYTQDVPRQGGGGWRTKPRPHCFRELLRRVAHQQLCGPRVRLAAGELRFRGPPKRGARHCNDVEANVQACDQHVPGAGGAGKSGGKRRGLSRGRCPMITGTSSGMLGVQPADATRGY